MTEPKVYHRRLIGIGIMLAFGVGSSRAFAVDESLRQQILTPVGPPGQTLQLKPPAHHYVAPEMRAEHLEIVNQLPGLQIAKTLTFDQFLRAVAEGNLQLAAQKFNIPIAAAQLDAARVYPDPTIQSSAAGDVSGKDQGAIYSAQLGQEIVMGGKITQRLAAAQAGLASSNAALADYWRNLRATAADAFIDGLTQILIIQRKIKALQRADQLVALNSQRLQVKQSSEDNFLRAKVGELEARSDLLSSEATLQKTLAGLNVLSGQPESGGLIVPQGNFSQPPRNFALQDLINHAMTSRSDVLVARAAVDKAKAQYRLTRANLIPDPTVAALYVHNTAITHPLDPAPRWDSLGMQLQIAIPLSDLNNGTRQAAYYNELQAERQLTATELQTQNDVRTAYESYRLAVVTTEQFGDELLNDARSVYKERLFKLEKGLVALTDVLDAHAALNQLYIDYFNALDAQAKALVALEQAAGIWDISF